MSPRNYRLDSLRGIAAFCVLLHHSMHLSNRDLVPTLMAPTVWEIPASQLFARAVLTSTNGGMAVYIFFILSGAVLMRSLSKETSFGLGTMIRFVVRRIFRIYPAMIVTVIIFAAMSYGSLPYGYGAPFTPKQLFENLLLIGGEVNGGTWTLQTEMLMIPLLLLAGWAYSRYGAGVLMLLLFWAPATYIYGPPFGTPLLTDAIPAFALGMFVSTDPAKHMFKSLPRHSWAVFLLLMLIARFYFSIQGSQGLLLVLTFGFLAVGCLYHSEQKSHPFDRSTLIWLGKVSYGVYLIHVVVLWSLMPYWASLWGVDFIARHFLVMGTMFAAVCAAIVLPLAALCEKYIEMPFIRLGQKFTAPRIANTADASTTETSIAA